MWSKLRAAAEVGLIAGVKVLVFLAVILLGAGWIIGDYAATRQKASYAFDITQKIVAQSQKATTAVKPEAP